MCAPIQRYKLQSAFFATIAHRGAQDVFITISPSDVNDVRISKIASSDGAPTIHIDVPATWPGVFERQKMCARSPVSVALWFRRVIHASLSAILNYPIDADKANSPAYVEHAHRLMRKGGLMILDNMWRDGTAQPGLPIEAYPCKEAQILAALNVQMKNDPRWEVVVLPLRDGLSLCRKI